MGSGELLDPSRSKTPDDASESVSMSERSGAGNDSSPSKSLCSSTSTSAENLPGALEMKVDLILWLPKSKPSCMNLMLEHITVFSGCFYFFKCANLLLLRLCKTNFQNQMNPHFSQGKKLKKQVSSSQVSKTDLNKDNLIFTGHPEFS